jgi:drug/metabolite transporter (DMT)-like permease
VHALWNLLLAGARDAQAATAAALVLGCLVCSPALLFGSVGGEAVPWIVTSAVLELAYFALLALAYSRGELSAVYPLARGSAPVIVLVVSVVCLGVGLSVVAALGVVAVGVGVLLVRGFSGLGDAWLALAVGACIAGYTLVDNEGLRHADPLPYLWLVLVVPAFAYAGWLGRDRVRGALGWRTVAAGVGMFAAYALTLAALQLAAAAPVAAVRETSIVVGVLLGWLVLREPLGFTRFAGASVIVGGVAVIALA